MGECPHIKSHERAGQEWCIESPWVHNHLPLPQVDGCSVSETTDYRQTMDVVAKNMEAMG